jgi:hypothetical protein
MSARLLLAGLLGSALAASAALAAELPQTRDEVARPVGTLPGDPEIALVKVADGFNDPVNVTNAGDGSGRIFVVTSTSAASASGFVRIPAGGRV